MMSDEHESGRMRAAPQALQELKEMVPRSGVQTRARFIQNQHRRFAHQGASNKHALPFAMTSCAPMIA